MAIRIPSPPGAVQELAQRRTSHSKTFLMPNGQVRLRVKPSFVHWRDADGTLRDIDLDSMDGTGRLDQAIYILEARQDIIGMRYTSRATNEIITCRLVAIGGTALASLSPALVVSPTRANHDIRWLNCLPGLSIVLRAQPGGVAWIKRLADATVPRSFTWRVTRPSNMSGISMMSGLRGMDNINHTAVAGRKRGKPLELTLGTVLVSDDGFERVSDVTETWTGNVLLPAPTADPIYPVEFDPEFCERRR